MAVRGFGVDMCLDLFSVWFMVMVVTGLCWFCVTSECFCGLWETVDLNGCVLIKLKLSLCYGVIMGYFLQVICESSTLCVCFCFAGL
jgi:hypothetical protein